MSSKKEGEKAGKQPPVKKEKNDKKEKNEKKMDKAEKTGGPSEGKESKPDSTGKQGKEQSKGKEQVPFTGSSPDPKGGKSSSKKNKPTGPTQQMVHIVEAQGPISLTPEDQKMLSSKQIHIGQPMRSGGFGMIYTASSGSGQGAKPMVAKVVELAGLAPTYFKEVSNWREMKHANVNPAVEILALQQPDRMLVFMEPADFDLQDLVLKQPNWVGKKLAAQYYWQINRGLQFMHSKNFAHRNLKPRNLLICKARGMEVRLSDCGMSRVSFAATHPESTANFSSWHETFGYLAPEVFGGHNQFCPQLADLWSVGAVLFFILYKVVPFQTIKMDIIELADKEKRLEVSKTGRVEPPEDAGQGNIEDALMQISLHFKIDPNERPTAKQVIDTPAHYGKWSNWSPTQAPGANWFIPPNH